MLPYRLATLICKYRGHKWSPWRHSAIMLPGWEIRDCQRCIAEYEIRNGETNEYI